MVPAGQRATVARRARVRAGGSRAPPVVSADARALGARARGSARPSTRVKRAHLWLIAFAAIAPRLAVLVHERGRILTAFTDKSDDFAQTFVHHGTFGFIPGEPSAYTQPLYGFFLVPIYWIFGRTWWAVGGAQVAVATATAILVYAIGARVLSRRAGTIAAILATLNPYLVWHDVHLNREVLDQLVGVALILCTLIAADRRSVRWATAAGILGGVAVLGNVRLIGIPLVVAAYLVIRNGWSWAPVALVAAAALAVTPWVVRNKVEVGCFALTTDGRALWKANNAQTYGLLAQGKWIDDVKDPPHHPFPNPEEARDLYRQTGKKYHVDECANQGYYEHKAWKFVRGHPGEKAKLAAQAVRMEWDPRTTASATDSGHGAIRSLAQPLYTSVLYALGLIGIVVTARWFAGLALAVLAYQTLAAMVFVGATRYRIATDFLIALLAAGAIEWVLARWRRRPR
ncbi:MAG: glycosyltransferase family 39 protein [Actinobacteria bacterium]|nr:MAG: glycosyltransferase family 39 protein [Actinomycetota bacterium]